MSNDLRLALAQLNPVVGDLDGNAQKILETWQAYDAKADLVIFPELFLCGYPPEDLVLNAGFISNLDRKIKDICERSKAFQSAAIVPSVWKENNTIYNAALLIKKGEIEDILYKHKLPNDYVFDEPRTFASGPLPSPMMFRGHKLGIMICEDVWHVDVPRHLKNCGAEVLIAINGSPFHVYQDDERRSVALECVLETGLDLIYLNMVGGQDELVFDGRSFIMQKDRTITQTAPGFEEHVIELTISGKNNDKTFDITSDTPPVEPKNQPSLMYNALKIGVRDYVRKNGFHDVLIGLSGGIDSALTAAIAVDALGADHVRCVMMPSEFTSQESLDDAQDCAKKLGVQYEIIPINDAVSSFENTLPDLSGLAHENTQSRIRGTILMALSNMSGAMVLTTGNKSEVAVGYCTLYGDMNGGFNALKDVYKTDVYKLSEWRNEQGEVIPKRIIIKAPSAELREDQKDQDSLPPYDLLDDILRLLIEYDNVNWDSAPKILQEMRARCLEHPETVEKVARLLKNSEYKRFQGAPGTRISFRAFGRDRRYPMTNQFINKIEKSQ
tara:strand:+ start:12113 stop:13777 length:1665 start_codon:yes stop_codon:yes gene_type:complete